MRTRGLAEVQEMLGDVAGFLRGLPRPAALEVGCGFGHAMRDLLCEVPGLRVVGMNLVEYPEQVPGQEYVYGDAGRHIPLPDGSVDLVYSIVCLPFVRDRARFFEEAFRVLRPGGQVRVRMRRDLGEEAGDVRHPDVVEGLPGISTLPDYLLSLPRHDVSCEGDRVLLRKREGDPPLRLHLRAVDEKRVDYGDLYGERVEGFLRNWYVFCGEEADRPGPMAAEGRSGAIR